MMPAMKGLAMTNDPFTILGVSEEAEDEEIKRRYLALVRAYPPDQAPDRFQIYRSAYEALADERSRLESLLLRTNGAALSRLISACLEGAKPRAGRASKVRIAALLAEGISRL
jgi:curved DNA-binding protein CbpA